MDSLFYSLNNALEEIQDATQLVIPRAQALYRACGRHKNFQTVQLLRHQEEGCVTECIVIDIECDGVPPNNPYGIEYRERLAFVIAQNQKTLIEVLALRKTFPILMHQNNIGFDAPASLCLYFEPIAAVLRTWTPESFLRRVQWWLEKTAKGELHLADQPVEQLFLNTHYELVLPWNFSELKKTPGQRFNINRGCKRANGGETFFVFPAQKQTPDKDFSPIEITLPPVLHGHVERIPNKLSQLVNILHERSIDVICILKASIQDQVNSNGIPVKNDSIFSILLLHTPVCRTQGEHYERIITKAFLLTSGPLKLGEKLGALFIQDDNKTGKSVKTYYKEIEIPGTNTPKPETDWQEIELFPMEILQCNDIAMARQQSGIADEGPQATLVGAGSLGSAMLNLWGRSGWGRWTVIDNDHIKPHNLVRHVAYCQHIGALKSDAVAELHTAVTDGASEITPLCADACNFDLETVAQALQSSTLVVDASTTLEYPRLASTQENFGRHISVFITPSGNAAVMLAEDADRIFRLRTLEAQYYRAIIQETWGISHLDGNLGSFWSGASCRDISTVLPYSRIIAHAATLAEQIQHISSQREASIHVWARDPDSGSVTVYKVPVHKERRLRFESLDLFIDGGLEQQLREQRTQKLPNETGGVLLGYYDLSVKAVVVVDALPAPSDSVSTNASFERGIAGLFETITEMGRRTAGVVQYIGEWHSHPPGHSSAPSQDDLYQLAYLSQEMAQDGLPAVSLIVGEHDIQPLQGVWLA